MKCVYCGATISSTRAANARRRGKRVRYCGDACIAAAASARCYSAHRDQIIERQVRHRRKQRIVSNA